MIPKVIPAIRRCIYCLRDSVPLGREHVVPEGLGGTLILLKACCRDCEDDIRKYEASCIVHTFESPRTYLRIKSKRKHKARKRRLLVGTGLDPHTTWSMADFDDFPFTWALPRFPPPPLLLGEIKTNDQIRLDSFTPWMAPTAPARFAAAGEGSSVFTYFHPEELFRFFAKIGHGFAVAELGLEGFEHLATNMIRGLPDELSRSLVGMSDDSPPTTGALHELAIQMVDGYVTVLIQLFAPLTFPTFQVVVGRRIR